MASKLRPSMTNYTGASLLQYYHFWPSLAKYTRYGEVWHTMLGIDKRGL